MMLEVARAGSAGTPVSMTVVSRETDISKSYLEQLAIPLRSAGLLMGRAGRSGGYVLARPADQIKVCEIVEATIGPIDLVECVSDPHQCARSTDCQTRLLWALVTNRVKLMLEEYSLEDLNHPEFVHLVRDELGTDLLMPHAGERKPHRTTCGPESRNRPRKRPSHG